MAILLNKFDFSSRLKLLELKALKEKRHLQFAIHVSWLWHSVSLLNFSGDISSIYVRVWRSAWNKINVLCKLCLLPLLNVYRVFSHDVTAAILVSQNDETVAMLVSQTNPMGVELFSSVKTFFCSNTFAWKLATWDNDQSATVFLYPPVGVFPPLDSFHLYNTIAVN